MKSLPLKPRDASFDILRGIAIFFVIYIHTSGIGLEYNVGGFNFYLTIVLRQIANFAVPMFFFISGFFMYRKSFNSTSEYFSYIKKQLSRVLIPLFIWSLIYSAFNFHNIRSTLISIFTFQAAYHFYFIFAICQFYVILPFIKKFLVNKTGVAISFLVSSVSCLIIEYFRYYKGLSFPLIIYGGAITTWIVFPVLGMYIASVKLPPLKRSVSTLGAISVALSIVSTLFIYYNFDDIMNAVSAVKVSSFLYSVFIILLLFTVRPLISRLKPFAIIGELSFGIYFNHMLFLTPLSKYLNSILPIHVYSNVMTQIFIASIVLLFAVSLGMLLRKVNKNLSVKYLGY